MDDKLNLKKRLELNCNSNQQLNEKPVDKIILLAHAKQGKNYKVINIYGGHCLISRLSAMGIVNGDTVKVIHQTWGGPMTIAVKGVRIAIGRGIAHKIEVVEAPDNSNL